MAGFDDVVIIAGCRTPVGKFQGSLSDLTAPQLGAIVVREAVKRAHIDPRSTNASWATSSLLVSVKTPRVRRLSSVGCLPR